MVKPHVLFYHGIAGIGKSKLQNELQKILNEEYPEILWAAIDLNTKTYREVGTFLITLRNEIQDKCNAKFYLFNIAHAIYWKKLHPEIPLIEMNYPLIKEEGFFSTIINILDQFGPARLTWDIINNAPDNIQRFFKKQVIDINKLAAMKAHELEELLPVFFAADFTDYLGTTNSRAYIFVDTYEVLWDSLKDKDRWIRRNLIQNMLGVSWVICGREELLWHRYDKDCEISLESHSVDELPENFCQEFLEDCGIGSKEIRDIIVKASEGVPYYLNLSVDIFEKIYKEREPLTKDFGKTQPEIFERFVRYLEDYEIRSLEVLSAPNFWDRDLFKILMNEFDPGLPRGAFSELIKFSFIKTDANGKYSIHQLMRKSLQEYQDSTDRKNTHQFLLAYYSDKIEDLDIKTITQENETALTEAFYHAKEALEAEELCKWFFYASAPFNRAAFWQLITPMYEEMLQILESELGPEHPDVAATLNSLAGLYESMGEYEKAFPLYQRALDIREKVLGPQHPDVADSLNSLAGLYESMGEYEKALSLYQRALSIREKVLDSQHLDIALTLNNLSLLYHHMGNYEKALPLNQRALDICEKVLGPQHPNVAATLNNLAELYRHMGEYEKTLPLYQRVLDICEKVLGPQHPHFATTLNNIASLYKDMGEYEKALQLYQRVLEIREEVLGPQHPHFATTLNNLALVYNYMGNYEKALPLYQRALDIREKVLDPQHPDVAVTLTSLASLYTKMEKYEKALSLNQRALDICEKVLGPQHPQIATTLNNLAGLYYYMEDYEKVIPLYQRALDIREKVLGPQHPDVATTLDILAILHLQMGEYEKALPLYQRYLEINEKVLGPRHPDVAATLNNLAGLYEGVGEYEKALPCYQRALEIIEDVLGQSHPTTMKIKNNYSGLLSKINEENEEK
jgi:tetratricopeptide (TPR) repeat protein